MPTAIGAANYLVKNILDQRRVDIENKEPKFKPVNSTINEYGSTINIKASGKNNNFNFEYIIPLFSQMKKDDIMKIMSEKNIQNVTIDITSNTLKFDLDASSLTQSIIENYSKILYYCLLSSISPIYDTNAVGKEYMLQLDNVNNMFIKRMSKESAFVTYSIQTKAVQEDQTLMAGLLRSFTDIKAQKVSFSYTKIKPSTLPIASQEEGTYYVTITINGSLTTEENLISILYFTHNIHMHMKAIKNTLLLQNSKFIALWTKKFNRCLS